MDSAERELHVSRAKFAEQAERYEDMREAIKAVVESGEHLTPEERNLLSVAYKNICGSQRSAWRIMSSLINNAETNLSEIRAKAAKEMREKIVAELNDICNEVIGLIDKCLNDSESDVEHKTFFCKMRGDYYRYLVEVTPGDSETRSELAEKAKKGYEEACEYAEKLPTTNPLRLGLALNYSVFYYEIEGDPKKACELAKKSFDNAIAELDTLKEDSYKDSTLIMQLLRDNLTLWQSEDDGEGDANE